MIYFGITIGPIIETLDLTSSPAGLWCASYMFSDITYQICCELETKFKDKNLKIYSPYFPLNEVENKGRLERIKPNGVGSYHDRIIFSCGTPNSNEEEQKQEYEDFVKVIDEIINEVKNRVIEKLLGAEGSETVADNNTKKDPFFDGLKGLKEYLSIQYLSLKESNVKGKNILLTLNQYLDSIELDRVTSSKAKHVLKVYFENDLIDDRILDGKVGKSTHNGAGRNDRIKNSTYIKDIAAELQNFNEEQQRITFPLLTIESKNNFTIRNITQIATHNRISDFKEHKSRSRNEAAEQKSDFEKPDRYFALIQADGDHMGRVLGRVANQNLELFSEKCMEFSQEAAKKIHQFGGVTVYAGGDDLLFMAPLYSEKSVEKLRATSPASESQDTDENTQDNLKEKEFKTIIELCQELNVLFKTHFSEAFIQEITGNQSIPKGEELALSFGITLNYHKSPLYEALKRTLFLLFGEAKGRRNSKVVELTKNSGSQITIPLYNGSAVEKELIKLIHLQDEEEVVNSILYHLHEFENLYNIAFCEGEEKIKIFFYNMFDRHIDKDKDTSGEIRFNNPYVEQIQNLAIAHWREVENANSKKGNSQNNQTGKQPVEWTKELTSLLRVAKFFGEGAKDE